MRAWTISYIFLLKKFLKMISSINVIEGQDVLIESRDNRLRKWKTSEGFKVFQYNLLYFLFLIVVVYAASYFTDFSSSLDLIMFVLLFTLTLFLGIIYCQGFSKYIKVKWYEYILFEGFYGLVFLWVSINTIIF